MTMVVRPRIRLGKRGGDLCLAFGIERRRRLVEQQKRRVAQNGARNGDALALAAGQRDATLADRGVEALRQSGDEARGMGMLGRARDFGIGSLGAAEADIVAHRGCEHHAVLRHERDARAQLRRIEIGKAHAVERDASGGRIVEAQQKMKDRALAGAGRSDNGDLLALAHAKRNAVERRHAGARRIGEAHVIERDLAARRHRQRQRMRRTHDRRLDGENLEQPLGCARGLRDLAADFRQRAERARGEHGVENELSEPAGA